jgi:hypothetical protein
VGINHLDVGINHRHACAWQFTGMCLCILVRVFLCTYVRMCVCMCLSGLLSVQDDIKAIYICILMPACVYIFVHVCIHACMWGMYVYVCM